MHAMNGRHGQTATAMIFLDGKNEGKARNKGPAKIVFKSDTSREYQISS
jgi:hypothetical protein